jgi:thiol-disulfide isomerase/thioredoxin
MNTSKRERSPYISLVLAGLLVGIALSAHATVQVGDSFPDLSKQKLEGNLPALTPDKVVLVDFWASWCGPCAGSFPVMEELHQRYKERGLVIVAVNVDEKAADMEAFLKKRSASFAVVRDAEHKLVSAVNVKAMPTSFILDGTGKVRFMHNGFRGEETKRKYIEQIESLLKGTP